jgi:hypothetical protein
MLVWRRPLMVGNSEGVSTIEPTRPRTREGRGRRRRRAAGPSPRDQAKQAADGGGLAGAVRPQEPEHAALGDRQIKPSTATWLPPRRRRYCLRSPATSITSTSIKLPLAGDPSSSASRPLVPPATWAHARSAHAGLCASPRLCWPAQPLGALRHVTLMSEPRRLKVSPRATWPAPTERERAREIGQASLGPDHPPWRSERTQASAEREVGRHHPLGGTGPG